MTFKPYIAALPFVATLIGCANMFETGREPLPEMSARGVCREVGNARYKGDMDAFTRARAEADKRIAAGAIKADECTEREQFGYIQAANKSSGAIIGR